MTDEQYTTPTAEQPAAQNAAPAPESAFDPADIEKNKVMAGLAYIIFFLPLIVCPESKFGKFHANQALGLLIVSVAGSIVLSILSFIVIGLILFPFFGIGITVLFILGLINGLTGKVKSLPVVGGFKIIKY